MIANKINVCPAQMAASHAQAAIPAYNADLNTSILQPLNSVARSAEMQKDSLCSAMMATIITTMAALLIA